MFIMVWVPHQGYSDQTVIDWLKIITSQGGVLHWYPFWPTTGLPKDFAMTQLKNIAKAIKPSTSTIDKKKNQNANMERLTNRINMTHRRYLVILMLFILSAITFMDRICISTASDLIMVDLKISPQMMGYIFAMFALSYSLFQIPSGRFADTYGPKKALASVVVFWSAFTVFTGMAWNAASMLFFRFFFGAGEAGAFPGSTRAVYNWVPVKERGIANGVFHSGGRVGAALSLVFMPWLIHLVGWRWMFIINGIIGFFWLIPWLIWFRDQPRRHPAVNEAECRYIEDGLHNEKQADDKIPFGIVITSSNMAFAMFQYFASGMTFFISLSWLFPYMKSQWGESATVYTPIPLIFGMFAHWISGAFITFLYHKGYQVASRRIPAMVGFALAAIGLVLCTLITNISPFAFIVCFGIAVFGVEMTIAPSWTFCMDIGGKNSGAVSGAMNMLGNLGSATSAVIFPFFIANITLPFFAEKTGSANSFLLLAATLNILAMLSWVFMNPKKKIETSMPKEKIRLKAIVLIASILIIFIGIYMYKTFFMS
jgi:ACS family glucarate transporter-like MFS transporter